MTVDYSAGLKSRRMAVVLDELAGGTLDLLAGEIVVARVPLRGGKVLGSLLTFNESDTTAVEAGYPDAARLSNMAGEAVVQGLTVGETLSDVRIDSGTVHRGQTVRVLSFVLRHA